MSGRLIRDLQLPAPKSLTRTSGPKIAYQSALPGVCSAGRPARSRKRSRQNRLETTYPTRTVPEIFVGMNSGNTTDKASLFKIFYGELENTPMISETPLNLECKLVEVINLKNDSEIFIGEIVETYSSKKFMRKGYPYMKKLDPILFSINSNSYYNVGRRIGWAWKSGLKIKSLKKENENQN